MRFSKLNVLAVLLFLACVAILFGAGSKMTNYINIAQKGDELETEIIEASTTIIEASTTNQNVVAPSNAIAVSALMPNPLVAFADEVETCPNDGVSLAKFYLCGTGDTRTISTGLTSSTIIWQQLDETSCPAITLADVCPNTNLACVWNTVDTGPDFTITTAGQYQVRIITNGVLERYYFNVSSNPLNPQTISTDLICGNDGRIEVTNIPADYEYSLNNPAGPYQLSPVFDITSPGSYTVYVRQQGVGPTACIFPTQPIDIAQLDINVNIAPTDIICNGDFGAIAIQVNSVPEFYNYSLSLSGTVIDTFGPSTNSTYTFDNLNSGTYEVVITTDDGCFDSQTVTISTISDIDLTAFATESFGCGSTSVDITANASGGVAPYQFSVDGGALQNSNILTVNAPGDYTILVEDSNGCQETIIQNVPNILPPVFNITANDSNCAGANDGQILINVTDSRGYQLSFSNDNGVSFQNATNFIDLAPSSYDVIIRYESGPFSCDIAQPVIVNSASTINATSQLNTPLTCLNNAEVEIINATGGTPPYTYSIGGSFSTNSIFNNLTDGIYTPRVRDSNGCIFILPAVTIDPIDQPTDLQFAQVAINCAAGTVDVQVTTTGGGINLNYEIVAPTSSIINNGANNTFSGLGIGSYTFQVTDTDTGCSFQESYAITDISSIVTQGQLVNNTQCLGSNTGAVRFSVNGFDTTYSYSIDTSPIQTGTAQTANTIDFPSLPAGTYTLTVTDDSTSCPATAFVTVQDPPTALGLTTTVTPMNCGNNNRGQVQGNASGGWGGYRYRLEQPNGSFVPATGFRNNNNFTNLSQSGTYILEVQDSNGCVISATPFSLTPVDVPVLQPNNAGSVLCYDPVVGSTLAVQVQSGTGTAPFEYTINGGPTQLTPVFSGLTPGSYTINVVDANGCEDDITLSINQPVNAIAFISENLRCATPTPLDAEITINVGDGYTPYGNIDVSINNGAYTNIGTLTGSTFTYPTSTDGTYKFQITDAEGCQTETNEVIIDPIPTLVDTSTKTDTACNTNNGSIQLSADPGSGTPPFSYDFGNTGTFTSQSLYSNLGPGTYTYNIRDSNNCTLPTLGSLTIDPSSGFTASTVPLDETCAGGNVQGSITVTPSGGTAPYTYQVYNLFTGNAVGAPVSSSNPSETFNLDPGSYYVVVTDSNGCQFATTPDIISGISDVTLDYTPPPPTTCSPTGTAYEVTIVGGTGCFQIGLAGGLLGPPTPGVTQGSSGTPCERNHSFAGVIGLGGSYTVEIFDQGTGCTYFETIVVPEPDDLRITAVPVTTSVCNGTSTGEISYTVDGYTGDELEITVIDRDTGLAVFGPTTISVPLGTGPGSTYNSITNITGLPAGNYDIRVRETAPTSTLCSDGDTFDIIPLPPLFLYERNNVAANCNVGAQVTVEGLGGSGSGYTYQFVEDGVSPVLANYTTTNTATLDPVINTDWDVWVLDSNGCTAMIDIVVASDPLAVITAVDVLNQCSPVNGRYDITINATTTGVTGPIEYSIRPQGSSTGEPFQTSSTFVGISPGNYDAVLEDGNGCEVIFPFTISPVLAINTIFSVPPTCNATDGEITVVTQGGSGDITYTLDDSINPPVIQINNNVFTGYGPGTYNITVIDNITSCPDNDTYVLDTRVVPSITSLNPTEITCNGETDASFTVDVTNIGSGAEPLTYILYSGVVTGSPFPPELANQTNNAFTNLTPGQYTVRVLTAQGCDDFESYNFVEPSSFIITTNTTDFTCNPTNNSFSTAQIEVVANGTGNLANPLTGTGPYTYSIDGTNFQSNNVFEIVDNGSPQTFTVEARDARGCEAPTQLVTFNPPNDLNIQATVLNPITCSNDPLNPNPAVVQIEVLSGGGGDYIFYLVPIDPSNTVDEPNGTSSTNFNISTPGDYLFAVEDELGGGCRYFSSIVTIDPYDTIQATISNPTAVCFLDGDLAPQNTGTVDLDVNGHTGAFDYEVFLQNGTSTGLTGNGIAGTTLTINNLPGDNVYVEITTPTATPFCPTTTNVITIPAPSDPLVVSAIETANVTCTNNLGVIVANASGGWGGYEYRVTNTTTATLEQDWDPNNVFAGLSEGDHIIELRDIENCSVNVNVVLNQPAQITGEIEPIQLLFCPGDNDAAIRVDATLGGGEGSYIFRINQLDEFGNIVLTSGPQSTQEFYNLPAGDYSITIRDGWDCSYTTLPFNIPDPEPNVVLLREVVTLDCVDPAQLEINITNPRLGINYEYLPSTNDPLVDPWIPFGPGLTTTTVNRPQGDYRFLIREAGAISCPSVITNQVKVDPVPPLGANLDDTNANLKCTGEATAIIRAEAFGGVGDYRYELYNAITGLRIQGPQDSGIFRDLPAGEYYIEVDSRGCNYTTPSIPVVDPTPLTAPNPLITNVSCFGGNDGSITLQANGGTGPIQFAISDRLNEFFDEQVPNTNIYTFNDLTAGVYDVIIQDSVGCFETYQINISEPAPIAGTSNTIPESCLGDDDGIIRIQLQGGTPPYFTTLDPSDPTSYIEDQLEFTNLQGNQTYQVYVRDSRDCQQIVTVDLGVGIALDPTYEIRYDCPATTLTNEVEVNVGAIPLNDVMFRLDNGSLGNSNIFTQLSEGDHEIEVVHRNGCSRTINFSIITSDPITVSLVETANNVLTANVTGGVPPYTYFVNGENVGDNNVIIVPENGVYEVRVVDTNGCEALDRIDYLFIDVEIPNFFSPNGDGQNDFWAPINQVSFPNIESEIYDRYGRLIKKLAQNEKWDGRYDRNSKPLPSGDYWYVIRLKDFDNREFTGHFTLLR